MLGMQVIQRVEGVSEYTRYEIIHVVVQLLRKSLALVALVLFERVGTNVIKVINQESPPIPGLREMIMSELSNEFDEQGSQLCDPNLASVIRKVRLHSVQLLYKLRILDGGGMSIHLVI